MHEIVLAYSYSIFGPTTQLQVPFQKAVSKLGHSKQPKNVTELNVNGRQFIHTGWRMLT